MLSNIKYIIIGIALAFVFGLFFTKQGYFDKEIIITTTDTIYVDSPYEVEVIKEVEKPVKVYVYQTDTNYRKQLEKDTLVTFVSITPKVAEVHTLTPKGEPNLAIYPIEDFTHLNINHKGKVKTKKKKRFWRNLERIGIFIGGLWIGSRFSKKA